MAHGGHATLTTVLKTIALVGFSLAVLVGCSDGNPLREPGTGGATPRPIVLDTEPPTVFEPGSGFALASYAFEPGGQIPPVYTRRDGDDLSPPLAWTGAPAEAVELALVVTDPNASGFVHWVIWGLDPLAAGLDTGQVPADARQALNDFGEIGYAGPAPPEGDDPHLYLFKLLALGRDSLDIEPGGDGYQTLQELEARAIAVTELFAYYP